VPLAMPARADIIESTSADLLSAAATQPQADAPPSSPATEESSPADVADKGVAAEVIHERFPNRSVKVERHVVQDASGNYVNHGTWTMFDEKGRTVGCGDFRYGERNGLWTRWHPAGGKDMFSQVPYKHFQAPFVSEVTYDNGRPHGKWTVYDNKDRKCSEFAFEHGERQGKSVWYYPNGEKMREIDFTAGQLDGHWQEWGPNKSLTMNEAYQSGRRLAKKVETYPNGKTKSDGTYLFAREVLKHTYDWWNGTVTTTSAKEGKDQRHGAYTAWHKNGQKSEEGHYLNDLPVGKFTWWFANGQLSIEGQFDSGDRDGAWTWWHENGQKAVSGEFVKGVEIGKWTWWKEDGKVANSARITQGQSKITIEQTAVPAEPTIVTTVPTPPAKPAVRQARAARRAPATATRR